LNILLSPHPYLHSFPCVPRAFRIDIRSCPHAVNIMSQVQEKAQEKLAESTAAVPQSTAAQQSDNVAHALAGAGGGLLSMALTYALAFLVHAAPS
jgi:hypothetical protein